MPKSEDLLWPMFNMLRLATDYKFYLSFMKKHLLLAAQLGCVALCVSLTLTSCSDDDPGQPAAEEFSTITFEGDTWNALIDSPQYGGRLLYGASGYGFDEGETVYAWTDGETGLHSTLNAGAYGTAFWAGGTAVSNYHCDVADGSYTTQLSIPTGVAAHSGTNFLVVTGYSDETAGDTRAVLDFADGTPRKVRGLWVTPTSYFLHSTTVGDGFNAAATAATYVDVTFEGFDASGNSTGVATQRLQDGTTPLSTWTYVDLSALGKVASLKVNFVASADQYGSYGLNTPAYVAIDDIEVVK